ncbi:hypothetical protein ACFWIZ_40495, partial [Streptomyces sp. NPDC127044]
MPLLTRALTNSCTAHHAFMLAAMLRAIDQAGPAAAARGHSEKAGLVRGPGARGARGEGWGGAG